MNGLENPNYIDKVEIMTTKVEGGFNVQSDEEVTVKKEKIIVEKKGSVSFFQLFRYATRLDALFLLVGTFGSIANGCTFHLSMLFFTK